MVPGSTVHLVHWPLFGLFCQLWRKDNDECHAVGEMIGKGNWST
jgi:hypothetical protein